MNVVYVTGYRPNELGIFGAKHDAIDIIQFALKKRFIQLIESGVEWFLISGQRGVELWAIDVLLQLKETYTSFKIGVIEPFYQQEERYPDHDKERYQRLRSQVDFFDTLTKKPYENPGQLKLKTEWLIAKSDVLLLVYDEQSEGVAKYVLQAAKRKQEREEYDVWHVTFDDLQMESEQWFSQKQENEFDI